MRFYAYIHVHVETVFICTQGYIVSLCLSQFEARVIGAGAFLCK